MSTDNVGASPDSAGSDAGSPKSLPGTHAATVNVEGFLNSLPRMLLQTNCSLQSFLLTIVNRPHGSLPVTSRPGCTPPCPLPYPEVFGKDVASKVSNAHVKRLVNLHVLTLDWFHLGCPEVAPSFLFLGSKLSAQQWSAIRMMEFLAFDPNSPQFVTAAEMGRSATKVEDLQDCMDVLGRAVVSLHDFDGSYSPLKPSRCGIFDDETLSAGQVVGRVDKDPVMTAKPLEATRLNFPGPPSFNPRPYMDAETIERYDFPLQTGHVLHEISEDPPRVSVRATKENKLLLYRKLAESGRLKPVKKSTVLVQYPSGLFAVGKDHLRDRLVLDGRPANLADKAQKKWARAMASASTLSQVHLPAEFDLCISAEDLRDFFYQFQVGDERVQRNVLCDPVDLCDAPFFFGDGFSWNEDPVYVDLSTLAMGDVNAVEFAQSSHLGLCLQHGVALPHELLTLTGSVPRGLLQVGIIVDDLIVLEQVLKSVRAHDPPLPTQADDRINRALSAYASVGLEHNPKKEFKNETCARFWGLEVDGEKGLLRASTLRLWPLCLITMRVVRLGLATVRLLESLAGSWVSIYGVRRKLFCIPNLIFEPLGIPDQKKVLRLSPELISELCPLVIMGTLCVVNLRAGFFDQVVATDASEKWMAGVSAPCPCKVVQELARFSLRKAVWTKLLSPLQARDRVAGVLDPADELPDEHYDTHPLWVLMARALKYKESWREQVRRYTHINVLELRAHLRHERRLAASLKSLRVLYGLDSQVSLGCLIKGRSSSCSLNTEMQKNMCHAVASDLYDMYMYFPSADNPADGPSRESDVPLPSEPLPFWWHSLAEGHVALFDEWMTSLNLDTFLGGVDFSEVYSCVDVDLTTGAFEKKVKFLKRCRHPVSAKKPHRDARHENTLNMMHPESAHREVSIDQNCTLPAEACEILLSFRDDQFFFSGNDKAITQPGALDLFSGKCGVARAMVKAGAPWVLTFD